MINGVKKWHWEGLVAGELNSEWQTFRRERPEKAKIPS